MGKTGMGAGPWLCGCRPFSKVDSSSHLWGIVLKTPQLVLSILLALRFGAKLATYINSTDSKAGYKIANLIITNVGLIALLIWGGFFD